MTIAVWRPALFAERTVMTVLIVVVGGATGVSSRTSSDAPQMRIEETAPGKSRTGSSDVVRQRAPDTDYGGSRTALIVGIDRSPGVASLPSSVSDALAVRDALLMYGFQASDITTLLEEAATRRSILRELARLARRTPPAGVAVFAVITHARRAGGIASLRTAQGERINAEEVGRLLAAIRAPLWSLFATCYAHAFGVTGVVGPNRVATFSSGADELSYQFWGEGSPLVANMVRRGMIAGESAESVERAFAFAYERISATYPEQRPIISDGVPNELALGPVTWTGRHEIVPTKTDDPPEGKKTESRTRAGPTSSRPPSGRSAPGPRVCGAVRFNCPPDPG